MSDGDVDVDALFERDADTRLLDRRRRDELGLASLPAPPSAAPARFGAESMVDDDPASTEAPRAALLRVGLDARPSRELIPGAVVTVVVSVADDGDADAPDVRLRLTLPGDAEAVDGSFVRDGVDVDGEALLGEGLRIGAVPAGGAVRIRFTMRVLPGTEPLDVVAHATAPGIPTIAAPALRLRRRAGHTAYDAPRPFYELETGELPEHSFPTDVLPAAPPEPDPPPAPLHAVDAILDEPLVPALIVEPPEPVAAVLEPEPVAAVPEPEPVAAVPEPEPVAAVPEPEPVAVVPEPEPVAAVPEPVAVVPEPEPEPVVPEPEPVAAVSEPEPAPLPPPAPKPRKAEAKPRPAQRKRIAAQPAPAEATPPAAVPVPEPRFVLGRVLDEDEVRAIERVFAGAVPHGLAAIATLSAIACTDGPLGDALGLGPFARSVSSAMPRALVAARMGRTTTPVVTRDALEALHADAPVPNAPFAHDGPALAVHLDERELAALRMLLARDLPDAFLRGVQVLLAVVPRTLEGVPPAAAAPVRDAMTAYRAAGGAWLMRVTVRRAVDKRYDPLTADDPTLHDAGRSLVTTLREAVIR